MASHRSTHRDDGTTSLPAPGSPAPTAGQASRPPDAVRILHVVLGLPRGGLENGVVDIASGLPRPEFEQTICCLDSRGEMAERLPVIVTSVGSIPEVVQNGVQGLVLAPGDEDGLAAALARVAENAPELAAMGRKARDTVVEHYSLRASATRLLELYGELRG